MNRIKSIKFKGGNIFAFTFVMFLLGSCAPAGEGIEQEGRVTKRDGVSSLERGESRAQFMAHLAHKIWLNETGGDDAKLLWWNEGEAFPSLGIGHFIWFPKGISAAFEESFPALLRFMHERNQALPSWLEQALMAGYAIDAPWPNKEAFIQARNGQKALELQQLLMTTKALQAEFIAMRFDKSKEGILNAAGDRKTQVSARINSLIQSSIGQFALIDYVNFKGEGLNPSERYQGQGWGLLQVLLAMESSFDKTPIEQFIKAAKATLTQRVSLSPPDKNEARWLAGWYARLDAYRM